MPRPRPLETLTREDCLRVHRTWMQARAANTPHPIVPTRGLAGEAAFAPEALASRGQRAVILLSGCWVRGRIRGLEHDQDYSNYEYGFILAANGDQFYFKREWFKEHWPPMACADVVFRWEEAPTDDMLPVAFDIWYYSEDRLDFLSTWVVPSVGWRLVIPPLESANAGAVDAGSSGSTRPTNGEEGSSECPCADCLNGMTPRLWHKSMSMDDVYVYNLHRDHAARAWRKRVEGAEQSQGKPFGTHGTGKQIRAKGKGKGQRQRHGQVRRR